MANSFDVFLSYNSADRPLVEEIAIRLRDEAGLTVWLDKWRLAVGDNWQHGLEEGLKQSGACAVFAGPSGLGDWQLDEIRSAQVLRKERKEFQIVPVLLPGSDSKSLPLFLRSNFNWIDLRNGVGAEAIQSLVAGVRGQEQAATTRTTASDRCPYKGLDAYQESDAEFFFGRDVFVEQILLEHLRQSRSVAVVGMSGSGKSSAVRAGLLPRLRQERFQGSAPQHIITMKPGERPLEELAVQLVETLYPEKDRVLHLQSLLRDLQASEETLHLVLRAAASAGPFLILIDQFEEVFTLCNDDNQRKSFFDNICYAASLSDSPVHIVITMRSDFVSKCASFPDMNMLISENFLQMPDMTLADIRSAIVEPAKRAGLRFEHGLVEVIMHDVEESVASLPLLQHALLRLWEKRDAGVLTIAAYQEIGGVQGSLVQHAEEIFSTLTAEQQELCRKVFVRLVTLGEGTGDTRRRAYREELLSLGAGIAPLLNSLVDKRLLIGSKESVSGAETIEIIHEALIRGWPRLSSWLNADRDFLRFRQRLINDVKEWEKRGRSPDDVYRGAHLFEAEEFLKSQGEEFTPNERQFVEAGIARRTAELGRERKAKRRLQRAFIGASVGLVIAIAAFFYAEHQSAVSQSRQIAAEVLLAKSADPVVLLRRAIEAYNLSPTFEARQALRFAVRESSSRIVIEHNHALSIACSPADDKLAIGSEDSTVHVWSIPDQRLLFQLRGIDNPVLGVSFNDSGRTISAYSFVSRIFCLWDANSGTLIRKIRCPDSEGDVEYASNRFAATYQDGSFEIEDVRSGAILISEKGGSPKTITFSDNGKYAAFQSRRNEQTSILSFDFWDIDNKSKVMHLELTTGGSGYDPLVHFVQNSPYVFIDRRWKGHTDYSLHEREDSQFCVVDLSKGRVVSDWKVSQVGSWCFGNDKSSGRADGKLALCHTRSIEVVDFDPHDPHRNSTYLNFDAPGFASQPVFDKSGSFLLHITPGDASLSVWSIKDGQRIFLRGHPGGVLSGDFSSDSKYIVTLGSDNSVAIWPTNSNWSAGREEEVASLYGGNWNYSRFVNDSVVWTGREDFSLALLNLHTGAAKEGNLPLSKDNLATNLGELQLIERRPGKDNRSTILRIWDFPSFLSFREITDSEPNLKARAGIDSAGIIILSYPVGGKGVRVLDARDGHLLQFLRVEEIGEGDGDHWFDQKRRIVILGPVLDNNMVYHLFDVITGKDLYHLQAHTGWYGASYSDDRTVWLFRKNDSEICVKVDESTNPPTAKRICGFRLESEEWSGLCSDNKTIWELTNAGEIALRDVETGKRKEGIHLKPLNDQIDNVTFNKSMTRAIAGCTHGSIEIWDVRSGELLSDIPYGTNYAQCDLSGDGKYILAQGGNKEVQVYYTEIEDVLKLAKARLAQRTSGEFSRF